MNIKIKDESGIALVIALLIMVLLTVLGTAAIMTSTTDVKIGANFQRSSSAFYIAEAGLEAGLDFLGDNFNSTDGWDTYLQDPSSDPEGENITSNLVSSTVGSGSFNIYTLDDTATEGDDGDLSDDTNKKIYLTSKGTTGGSFSATVTLQEYIEFYQAYASYGGKDLTAGNTNVATGETVWGL